MQRREIIAWILAAGLLVSFSLCVVALSSSSPQLSATQKRELMELNDMLQTRLPQMVNAQATPEAGAGKGARVSVDGNDAVGQVNIQTGTGTVAGDLVHIKFTTPYETQPFVVVSPIDQPPPAGWYTTVDTNGFDIWVGTAPRENTNYPFSYVIVARPWLMYLNSNQ